MKNVHLLPTDKPSRVYSILGSKRIGFTSNDPFYTENFGGGTQNLNIYITSNEEIKEVDYITDGYRVWKWKDDSSLLGRKKIILTTDPELIANGVQPIDDEFLNWLVKNPSCEFVEAKFIKTPHNVFRDNDVPYGYYKIIIPQEETKQLTDLEIAIKLEDIEREEWQQETPEEAAEKQWGNVHRTGVLGFIEGANWHAERSYSKEEVRNIANWAFGFYRKNDLSDSELEDEFNRILEEKFKKK
jgi:hypothetical protein